MREQGWAEEKISQVAALRSREKEPDQELELAGPMGEKAFLLEAKGDLPGALALHEKVGEIYARNNFLPGEAHSLLRRGMIHRQLGNLDEAGELYDRAIDAFRRLGDSTQLTDALNLRCEIDFAHGNFPAILPRLAEAADILAARDDLKKFEITLNRMCEIFVKLGQYEQLFRRIVVYRETFSGRGSSEGVAQCNRSGALFLNNVVYKLRSTVPPDRLPGAIDALLQDAPDIISFLPNQGG